MESDRRRARTRVNIGAAFNKWRELRTELGIKLDAQLASFLLKSYEKTIVALSKGPSTSTPHHAFTAASTNVLGIEHPPSSVTAGESDRDDFLVAGVEPLGEDEGLEQLEQSIKSIELQDCSIDDKEATNLESSVIEFEGHLESDPYDSDYVPPISLRVGGPTEEEIAFQLLDLKKRSLTSVIVRRQERT